MLVNGVYGNFKIDYLIDLRIEPEELEIRKNSIKYSLKTNDFISERDIELMKKPKKPKKIIYEDEKPDDEEENQDGDDDIPEDVLEKLPKPEELIIPQNYQSSFEERLNYYKNIELPKYLNFKETKLEKNYYHKIEVTGFDYDEVAELIKTRLDFTYPSVPIATAANLDASDYKDLLMTNREGVLPFRRWSLWKQIDPVSLKDDLIILNGSVEFPAEYCQRVFLFISEQNRNKFLDNPKRYLKYPPKTPKEYRLAVFGPSKSGKKTVCALLDELFDLKTVNIEEITASVIDYQQKMEEPIPNSPYCNRIHLSQEEWKEHRIKKKPLEFYTKIVFMLDFLGLPLDKKYSLEEIKAFRLENENKWKHLFQKLYPEEKKSEKNDQNSKIKLNENEQSGDEGDVNSSYFTNKVKKEEEKVEESSKKGEGEENEEEEEGEVKEEEKKEENKNENEEEKVEEEEYVDPYPEEEEFEINEVKSTNFYYAYNHDYSFPRPGGFVMLSHPINEEEIKKLSEFNIEIDKVIYLADNASEEPLRGLMLRNKPDFEKYDEEKQQAETAKMQDQVGKFEEILTMLREKYNKASDDAVIEINCIDSIENIKQKLLLELNPFYTRIDKEERVYSQAENAEEKAPLPKGEYGNFCPVTYKEENWLFYSPDEFEVQVNQRRYKFAGEKEMEAFKLDPTKYLSEGLKPVKVFPPQIFIMGYQGGGTTTFVEKLSKDYKLKIVNLKKEFEAIWNKERLERRQGREEKKRQELIKQKEEEEKERKENKKDDDNNEGEPEMDIEEILRNDAGLDEEDENFNAIDNDKKIFKTLFHPLTATVYDVAWFDMDERITTPLIEFIIECRRAPNVVIVNKVELDNILKRHLHLDKIKARHKELENKSKEKKNNELEKLKSEKRNEKIEEIKENINNNEDIPEEEKEAKILEEIANIELGLTEEERDSTLPKP